MSAITTQDLLNHSGHTLSIYTYRDDKDNIQSATIECDDCSEVLLSIDDDETLSSREEG